MKFNVKQLIILCVASIFMYSCSHEAGEDDPINDLGSLKYASAKEYLADNAPTPDVKSLDANVGGSMTTKNGISFYFYPNIFEYKGQAVTGMVDVEVLEVLDPVAMMTTGATTNSSQYILESGGMFNIKVKQNGNELQLKNGATYSVNIPSNGLDFNMRIFSGVEGEDIVRWEERDSAQWRSDSTQKGYVMELDFLNWCNLDKYHNEPNQTKVRVKLPDGYTNTNTSVYMVFQKNMVTWLFGDPTNEEFNTGTYTAPIGFDVKFVIISVKDKKLYYAIVDSKLVKDHLETVNSLTETTEDDLKVILDSLK